MIQLAVLAPTVAMRIGLRAMLQEDPNLHMADAAPGLAGLEASLSQIDVLVLASESPAADLPPALPGDLPALLLLTREARAAREVNRLPWRAWGLLTPDATPEELHAAVYAVHQGLLVGTPELLSPLLRTGQSSSLLSDTNGLLPGEALTGREMDVLRCLAQGLANKQISQVLTISEHTVKFHVSSIYTKLGATNRTEAVRLGVQKGLVAL